MFGQGRGGFDRGQRPADTSTEVKKIDASNAEFCMKNGFLSMTKKEENGEEKVYDFEGETKQILVTELERKYYEPRIKTIVSLKERYGFSYWEVVCEDGRNVKFTMQDTFRNIIRVGEDRAILLDVDGNRFVIESIMALDRKSHKKIELYM